MFVRMCQADKLCAKQNQCQKEAWEHFSLVAKTAHPETITCRAGAVKRSLIEVAAGQLLINNVLKNIELS